LLADSGRRRPVALLAQLLHSAAGDVNVLVVAVLSLQVSEVQVKGVGEGGPSLSQVNHLQAGPLLLFLSLQVPGQLLGGLAVGVALDRLAAAVRGLGGGVPVAAGGPGAP